MSTKKRIDLKKVLMRSGEKYMKVFNEQLQKVRQKGLGFKGKPKSEYPARGNTIASGLITKSSYEVIDLGDGDYDLLFSFPDYIQYLEKGVKGNRFQTKKESKGGGKSLFIESLLKWIKDKKLNVPPTQRLGRAIAIRKNIFKYGIAPTKLIENTTNIYLERYAVSIGNGWLDELQTIFYTELKKVTKKK
jgi:hypothetical protein